jgi:acid phosphatase
MSYVGAKIARPEGFHVEVWPMTACRLLSLALTLLPLADFPAFAAGMDEVKHLIIIYGENRSFDNLYGLFPNAEGLAKAEKTQTQVSKDGKVYEALPQPVNTSVKPPAPDTRFPANLPNKPFDIAKYVPVGEKTGDLVHRYWHEIEQIDGGKMDKFAAWSDAAGLAMGYYDGSGMALWKVAQKYTLADHFFHGAFGGSFLNHFLFVCACTPRYENAPADLVANLDANNHLLPGPDVVRPDGYAVNTMQTVYADGLQTAFGVDHRDLAAVAAADHAHHRRPDDGGGDRMGLVFRRLGRRARRQARCLVPVPPSSLRLFRKLRGRHRS